MTFNIEGEELKKLLKWQKQFKFVPLGAIGGSYSYCFTPTSLGVVITCKNNANGEEIDVTEYLDW